MACLKCNTDVHEECTCDSRPKLISIDEEDIACLTEARDILLQHAKDTPHIEIFGIFTINRLLEDYNSK